MLVSILTLFPGALRPYLDESILAIAQRAGKVRFHLVDFRDFARDRHKSVDDRPFGGGPGMVLRPEPIFDAVEELEGRFGRHHRVLLSPRGRRFDQPVASELAGKERILLCCGRYEGFDERLRVALDWDEISLGDFVLSGGEIPALALCEAVVRLLPGVLGHEESAARDSFMDEGLYDHPHYTRPREFHGLEVPDVLLSGDHDAIAAWRRAQQERLSARTNSRANT